MRGAVRASLGPSAAEAGAAAHFGARRRPCSRGAGSRCSCAANGEPALGGLQGLDAAIPEQVIDVPQISQDRIQQRLVGRDLRHPQMAEQLVEVPTVLSPALLQQLYAEQIVDNPVPGGGLHNPLPVPGASSAVSRDELWQGVFRTFPVEKSAEVAGQVSASVHAHSSSSTLSSHHMARGRAEDAGAQHPGLPRQVAHCARLSRMEALDGPSSLRWHAALAPAACKFSEVPQLLSMFRVLDIPVVCRAGLHSCGWFMGSCCDSGGGVLTCFAVLDFPVSNCRCFQASMWYTAREPAPSFFMHFCADWTQVWVRIVSLVVLTSLVALRWMSLRTTVTVFRLPHGSLLVMGATMMVQLTPAPSVWRRIFACTSCALDYVQFPLC